MKKLELETSKGRFLVEEASNNNLGRVLIKYITENQASEIVDTVKYGLHILGIGYAYYGDNQHQHKGYVYYAIESLHSLIKSKGYYLFENTCKKPKHYELWAKYGDFTQYGKSLSESVHQWKQSDKKTFYNPVIFKIS